MFLQYLIPMYNEASFIKDTLYSILSDKSQEFQVIISDNQSDDGSYEICKEISKHDSRVLIHRQRSNIGPALNFEFLSREITSEYAHFVGAHDQVSPNYTTNLLSFIYDNSSLPEYILPNYMWLCPESTQANAWQMERVNDHKSQYEQDSAMRYLAGIKYWPCWWFYSCVRSELLRDVMHNISDVGILNKDTLAVSHMLYLSKPKFLHNISYYGLSTQLDSNRADYNERINTPGARVTAGHYRDMLYWAITYLYHFGRLLANSELYSVSQIRTYLAMASIELVRIYPGSLHKKNRSWILFEIVDLIHVGKSFHGY